MTGDRSVEVLLKFTWWISSIRFRLVQKDTETEREREREDYHNVSRSPFAGGKKRFHSRWDLRAPASIDLSQLAAFRRPLPRHRRSRRSWPSTTTTNHRDIIISLCDEHCDDYEDTLKTIGDIRAIFSVGIQHPGSAVK